MSFNLGSIGGFLKDNASDLLTLGTTAYGYNKSRSSAPGIPYVPLQGSLRDVDLNRRFSTGRSRSQGGNLRLDPFVYRTQKRALGNANRLFRDVTGNRGAFIQARVNPLLERVDQGRGELKEGLSRRGVFGSIGNRDIQRYDVESERALGDARTLATQDSINSARGINQDIANIAQQRAQTELSALGLNADIVQNLIRIAAGVSGNTMSGSINSAQLRDAGTQNQLDLLGRGIDALGNPFSKSLPEGVGREGLGFASNTLRLPGTVGLTGGAFTGGAQGTIGLGAEAFGIGTSGVPGTIGVSGTSGAEGFNAALANAGTKNSLLAGVSPALKAMGLAGAVLGGVKFLDSIRWGKGGASNSAKPGKFAATLQRELQRDPTGKRFERQLNNLVTNKLWSNEGNQWVIQDLIDKGVMDYSYPVLHSKDSIYNIWDITPDSFGKAYHQVTSDGNGVGDRTFWAQRDLNPEDDISGRDQPRVGLDAFGRGIHPIMIPAVQAAYGLTKQQAKKYEELVKITNGGPTEDGYPGKQVTNAEWLNAIEQREEFEKRYLTGKRKRAAAKRLRKLIRARGYAGNLSHLEKYARK